LESHFSTQDLVQNERRLKLRTFNEMADKIDELNRRSFLSLLKRLLKHLELKADQEETKMFVDIRNTLVHKANFLKRNDFAETSLYEDEWRQFCRVLSFTSRIMLAIIGYRGYYHDWKQFQEGGWRGAETGRVKMPYIGIK
jgi:hypothetical protein